MAHLETYGPPGDQWLYDPTSSSYDLTRRTRSSPLLTQEGGGVVGRSHKVETQKGVIEVAVEKSALVIIDMQLVFLLTCYSTTSATVPVSRVLVPQPFFKSELQLTDPLDTPLRNFFLHPSLRSHSPGLSALHHLLSTAIPTARQAGIKILWVNWGLTLLEIEGMPPTHAASFGGILRDDKDGRREGFGSELGRLDGGVALEGGKLLVRDSWNGECQGCSSGGESSEV